ncbi:hypothetical protein C8F04DRAFT_1085313 [Mycena alexandri]|uniref:DUF6534 domain-containing protein n=1 Tax=Mycena alexandri TaxID=1745969 RepID=A0AAD6T5P0_9AGAR|nr:hypothetical protein C8F04DRAFT_1085313 [Mycena alexandri]
MPPLVIPGLDLAYFLGPIVLGYMFSYGLYGMLVVQLYVYSQNFPKDRKGIKAVVWTIFFFETAFTFFTTCGAWLLFGQGWGNTDTLSQFDWSWAPLPVFNGIIEALAQSFYIWRIWSLTNSIWMPIVISLVMLVQVVAVFYYGIKVDLEGESFVKLFKLSNEITLWLTASAACDVIITLTLVFILSRRQKTSTSRHTTGLINKMIRFSIETGTITSLGAICEVTLWLSCRQWNFHLIFFLILGKLYSNVLLATLNCRIPHDGPNLHIHTSFWSEGGTESGTATKVSALQSASRGVVHVSRTTQIQDDTPAIVMTDFRSNGDQFEKPKPYTTF